MEAVYMPIHNSLSDVILSDEDGSINHIWSLDHRV